LEKMRLDGSTEKLEGNWLVYASRSLEE